MTLLAALLAVACPLVSDGSTRSRATGEREILLVADPEKASVLEPGSAGTEDQDPDSPKDVKEVFELRCGGCHGKDGRAKTPIARKLKVKDLTVSKRTDGEIEQQIKEGRRDARGNLLMPSFKAILSQEEIDSLIAYVKAFRK